MGRGKQFLVCCVVAVVLAGGAAHAGSDVLRVKVVDEATGGAVSRALVVLGDRVRPVWPFGMARFRNVGDDRVSITAIYIAGRATRMVTFHDVPVGNDGRLVLPLPNALPLHREARFSLSVPFVPEGADWTGVLPQLGVQAVGPKLGIFSIPRSRKYSSVMSSA